MSDIRKSHPTRHAVYNGKRRFEHWYRDNQIYFITARCRDRFAAFANDATKAVFWDRFTHYTRQHGFTPIVTTLMQNHYHTLGHLRLGPELGPMMQRMHGSSAKLVDDLLPKRHTPFWHDARSRDYFDGCIRDEKQFRLAYRYTQTQARRAGGARAVRPHPGGGAARCRAATRGREARATLERAVRPVRATAPGFVGTVRFGGLGARPGPTTGPLKRAVPTRIQPSRCVRIV